jgi:hypothetical protein
MLRKVKISEVKRRFVLGSSPSPQQTQSMRILTSYEVHRQLPMADRRLPGRCKSITFPVGDCAVRRLKHWFLARSEANVIIEGRTHHYNRGRLDSSLRQRAPAASSRSCELALKARGTHCMTCFP